MEQFMQWLNNEIEALEGKETTTGQYSEAIRIRTKLCEYDSKRVDKDKIEKIHDKMCKWSCRYPQAYYTGKEDDNERMIKEKCSICPLDELVR